MEATIGARATKADRRGMSWFVFIVLLLCYIYFLPRWADWNVNSRMNLVLAIVEQNTLAIDSYYYNTGDYAFYNGHYFSDKAPGAAFVAIPFYVLFKTLGGRALVGAAVPYVGNSAFVSTLESGGRGVVAESLYYFAALTFVTFFTSALPSALLGVLVYRLAREWAQLQWSALVLALAFGLATPAFAYANNMYGHQLSAFLVFGAFYLVYRTADSNKPFLYAALTGVMLGAALMTEYPTALIVSGIGLYAIYKWRKPTFVLVAAAAGLLPLLLLFAHNYAIFQTPLPVGYLYSPLYSELHHTGLISLTYPKADALFLLGFGIERGLFLLSPFLLLAVPGLYWFARERALRAEFFVTLWAVLSFWLFNSSSAMWQGGFGVGPRYLVPMLPFMVLPIIFVFNHVHAQWARWSIGALIGLSWLMVWIVTLGGQQFPQYQSFPLLEYSLPQWFGGQIARNLGMLLNLKGYSSLAPLLPMLLGLAAVYMWRTRPPQRSARPAARNSPAALP